MTCAAQPQVPGEGHCEWCSHPYRQAVLRLPRQGVGVEATAKALGVPRSNLSVYMREARERGCVPAPTCPDCGVATPPGKACAVEACRKKAKRRQNEATRARVRAGEKPRTPGSGRPRAEVPPGVVMPPLPLPLSPRSRLGWGAKKEAAPPPKHGGRKCALPGCEARVKPPKKYCTPQHWRRARGMGIRQNALPCDANELGPDRPLLGMTPEEARERVERVVLELLRDGVPTCAIRERFGWAADGKEVSHIAVKHGMPLRGEVDRIPYGAPVW